MKRILNNPKSLDLVSTGAKIIKVLCRRIYAFPLKKGTTMPNGRLRTNIVQPNLLAHQIYDIRGDSARCFSIYSLLSRIINAELTVLTAMLTPPPPRLTKNKYYTSQDSIDFRVVLSLVCLRAFRPARNVSARAIFVALGLPWCILFLSYQDGRIFP